MNSPTPSDDNYERAKTLMSEMLESNDPFTKASDIEGTGIPKIVFDCLIEQVQISKNKSLSRDIVNFSIGEAKALALDVLIREYETDLELIVKTRVSISRTGTEKDASMVEVFERHEEHLRGEIDGCIEQTKAVGGLAVALATRATKMVDMRVQRCEQGLFDEE